MNLKSAKKIAFLHRRKVFQKSLKPIALTILIGSCQWCYSQTIERDVISSGGNTIENADAVLSITLGETFHEVKSNGEVILSAGMEQQFDLYTLSVVELKETKITLYPNPTANRLQVKSDQFIQNLDIVNGMGQVVKTIEVNNLNKTIGVEDLPAGIYFIQINQKDIQIITKFIKI